MENRCNFKKRLRFQLMLPTAGVFFTGIWGEVILQQKWDIRFRMEPNCLSAPPVYDKNSNTAKWCLTKRWNPGCFYKSKERTYYNALTTKRTCKSINFNTETHRNYSVQTQIKWMFNLLSIQLRKNSTSKEALKTQLTVVRIWVPQITKTWERCFGISLWARENHLLFGETSHANGKCTYARRERSIYLPIGDGVIKQIKDIEKFTLTLTTVRRYPWRPWEKSATLSVIHTRL
jgi:hypothetical protein